MKNTLKIALAAFGIAALAMTALAQPIGGGPGRDRGDQAGRQGQPGQMNRGGGMLLLMNPQVQKELKLTADQIAQIRAIAEEARASMGNREGRAPGERPGGQGNPAADKIKKVLTPEQLTRLEQIELQQQGAVALARDEIAAKVGIDKELQRQIREMQRELRPSMGRGEGRPDREELQQMMREQEAKRAELNAKILGLLNADQKAKWEALLGAPFKLERQIR